MRDLIGLKINHLTVLKEVDRVTKYCNGKKMIRRFLCHCDLCRQYVQIDMFQLTKKIPVKSCGCIRKIKGYTTDSTKNYRILYERWYGMLSRCYNKKDKSYKNYGQRGISVCERWKNFELFYKDMADGYAPGLSIERIDVDGNYEPQNCTWIPLGEQAKNRRTSKSYKKRKSHNLFF